MFRSFYALRRKEMGNTLHTVSAPRQSTACFERKVNIVLSTFELPADVTAACYFSQLGCIWFHPGQGPLLVPHCSLYMAFNAALQRLLTGERSLVCEQRACLCLWGSSPVNVVNSGDLVVGFLGSKSHRAVQYKK